MRNRTVRLHAQVTDDIHFVYPTPILIREVSEALAINPALRARIVERAAREPGRTKSNYGGWHSTEDLFSWPDPEIAELRRIVADAVRSLTEYTAGEGVSGELNLIGWANVSNKGDYNKPHHHPGASWSGVYYVDAGAPSGVRPDEGAIEFLDPRGAIDLEPYPGRPFSATFQIKPFSGLLVVFPAWLDHMVNRYDGEGPRVSIAFNLSFLKAGVAAGPESPPGA